MQLGTFSISLAVNDMAASRDFYDKLGFSMVAGDGESWTIVANESSIIGLPGHVRLKHLDVQSWLGRPRSSG